ncbi:MAG: hypothetical protein DMF69_06180 [Acidobacteria bacterium]|nr:MAG: hypothetical protein DMF69_06180 [Acidobacteriota bacterium]
MNTFEEKFRILLIELGPSLTAMDLQQVQELVDANELGVAFENFCTQLFERDAVSSRDQLDQIVTLGAAMGISQEYWNHLVAT